MRGKGNLARVRDIMMMFLVILSTFFVFLNFTYIFARIGTSSPCLNMYECMYKYVNLSVQLVTCKNNRQKNNNGIFFSKKYRIA